ncbi:unnamed protein product, partial [Bubo scandiacus]
CSSRCSTRRAHVAREAGIGHPRQTPAEYSACGTRCAGPVAGSSAQPPALPANSKQEKTQ